MGSIQVYETSTGDKRYKAHVRLKGHPRQIASFRRKTDAKRWIQDTEAAIREGRHFKSAEAKRHTVGDLIKRYLRDVMPLKGASARSQFGQLRWWDKELGHLVLADLTPSVLAEARDRLLRTPTPHGKQRSRATVNRYLAVLSHACTEATREWGWLETNPFQRVKKFPEPRGRVRFLAEDERERLLAACRGWSNRHLHPIVVLALATGMRKGEILGLRWADVDLERGQLVIHHTKNGDRRVVPVVGHARAMLREHRQVRRVGTDLLFPGSGRDDDGAAKPVAIEKAFRRALQRAGIEDFRFHDLRHSAASYLAMNGASPSEIAAVLGHKTLAMVKRYAHLSEAHTAGVVERMNESIFGGSHAGRS